jgi:hypothetical protein
MRASTYGRWDGCGTVGAFRFTGEPPDDLVRDNADRTLGGLGAEDIEIRSLTASPIPGVTAVRGDGYVTVASLRAWAQYSTYVASSDAPGDGRLIQQSITISADRRSGLIEDIAQLSNALQRGFLTGLDGG